MGKARLLVVEDDVDIANMLKIYFSGMEFDVDVANRGHDALDKTKHAIPHLIVLDIMLPDIDGYEVCRSLRTNTRTSHIPVIFLTQKDERSDKLQGLELGADDYLTKPFKTTELKAVVWKAYEKKALVNENLVLRTQIKRQSQGQRIISKNPTMLELLETQGMHTLRAFLERVNLEKGEKRSYAILVPQVLHQLNYE
jgi:DNA-binding response OmpR family regulator